MRELDGYVRALYICAISTEELGVDGIQHEVIGEQGRHILVATYREQIHESWNGEMTELRPQEHQ